MVSMCDAKRLIEDWRIEYNTERPHRLLRYLSTVHFAQAQEAALRTSIGGGAFLLFRYELIGLNN